MHSIIRISSLTVLFGVSLFFCSSCHSNESEKTKQAPKEKRDREEISVIDENGFLHHYNAKTQVHNYSGNFDFDGDIDSDSMYFVGTGGAHLYYYLKIRLSSTKKTYEFHEIQIDVPKVREVLDLAKTNFLDPFPPACVVAYYGKLAQEQFGENLSQHALFFHLDKNVYSKNWLSNGINSDYILVYFDKGKWNIRNFH